MVGCACLLDVLFHSLRVSFAYDVVILCSWDGGLCRCLLFCCCYVGLVVI